MNPAITQVKLYTGGKSGVKGKKSLFCLHCSGEAYGRADSPGWMHTPRTPIDPSKLQVLGKTPGADGKMWVALDDDSEQVITVTAKGVKDYNAGPQTTEEVEKYNLQVHSVVMAGDHSYTVMEDDGSVPNYHCRLDDETGKILEKHPVLYYSESGGIMEANLQFYVRASGNSPVVIRGVSSAASSAGTKITFWSTNYFGSFISTDITPWYYPTMLPRLYTYAEAMATANAEIPANKVDFYNPLTIQWRLYSPDMKVHVDAGTTKCPVYVSLKPPITGSLYRTVVHLACSKPGATTGSDALAHTWSFFSGQSVTTWDGQPLTYYKAELAYLNENVPDLLSPTPVTRQGDTQYSDGSWNTVTKNIHDGNCYAFAELLQDSLQVNGVDASLKTVSPPSGSYEFAVKNVHFEPGFGYPINFPYKTPTPQDGISGQNNTNPSTRLFQYHVIIFSSADNKYYDPSYGVSATSESTYINSALMGVDDGSIHWKTDVSGVYIH